MDRSAIEKKLRLQLITRGDTPEKVRDEVSRFLEGGGRWVQLRMKDAGRETVIRTAAGVRELCRRYGAAFILNDSPEIALETGADGVHIGKNDCSAQEARRMLGPEKIIGCTANTFDDVRRLAAFPIDYVGLGPYRFTTTKKNLSPVLGAEGYREILARMEAVGIQLPVVAIGGIAVGDIPSLNECGVRYYAVSGAIGVAEDPAGKTREFLERIEKCRQHPPEAASGAQNHLSVKTAERHYKRNKINE